MRRGTPPFNLKVMPIEKLLSLKEQVDATLASKVAEERQNIEAQLGKLSRLSGSRLRSSSLKGQVVQPKYRNPDNPKETWSGRGLRPRWLARAIKSGKKLEEFSIATATKTRPAKASRAKSRKTRRE